MPFIDHLDTAEEMELFLAHLIVEFLRNTARKAHQASVDVDCLRSFVKEDAVFLLEHLRDNRLNFGFFVSKHCIKLLTKLHFNKASLDSWVLSPFGNKMKWCEVNPSSIASRDTLICNLCQRKLDLNSFLSPKRFAFDPRSATCLCPAHAGPGGAAAQSPRFVSEVNVLLDIVRVYKRMRNTMRSELANLWDSATDCKDHEVSLSAVQQFVAVCLALGDRAMAMNEGDDEEEHAEDEEALRALKKHSKQCAEWILTNKKRQKELTKHKFLFESTFVEILLDYFWEFTEFENRGGRQQDQEHNLWKYVSFWLNEYVRMTPNELHQRVIEEGQFSYLKRLVTFLYGYPECESSLISDKNWIWIHLLEFLHEGADSMQAKMSSINVCFVWSPMVR